MHVHFDPATAPAAPIDFADFLKVDIRVGALVEAFVLFSPDQNVPNGSRLQ